MNEESLSKILMVRSCEEEDVSGRFISLPDRQRASRLANTGLMSEEVSRASESSEEQLILDRSRVLLRTLEPKYSMFQTARRLCQLRIPLVLIMVLVIVGGILTDLVGPKGQINLLHFPVLTLLLWNLLQYMWVGVRSIFQSAGKNGQAEWIADAVSKARLWISQFKPRVFHHGSLEEQQWMANSLTRFFGFWRSLAGSALRLQAKSLMHWGATSLAVGLIIGMYLRGFAFEYRASWSSTFLEVELVHSLLLVILSPAAIILGIDFPSVQTMTTLEAPGSENAATWIHLWAVTCLFVIIIPRVGLALAVRRKASKQLEDIKLPLEEPYFHRILAQYRGNGLWVEVLPYQCQLDHATAERLEGLCLEIFGNNAYVRTRNPIPYGEMDYCLEGSGDTSLRILMIFDIATTPEHEVHGVFLQHIQDQIESWPSEASLLVFIYEGAYQNHLNERRLGERYQTWKRFTNGFGLEPTLYSVRTDVNDLLQHANTRIWSSRSQEVQ